MSRNIRVRFPRRSRRKAPRGGEPDPAAPEPETAARLGSFDPFRRGAAEEEARQGIPASAATAPSPGERRAESRFLEGIARIRGLADGALGRLRAAQHEVRTRAVRIESGATRERERGQALADVQAACQRLDSRYVRSQAAAKELAGFRRARGLPDYVTPRPPSRGWMWLLLAVAVAETTANGLLLHSASTEGVVSNWLFAALVTGMNVGLLGWVMGDLIFRRMLGGGALRRAVLAAALLPCLFLAGLLHFGFAHYRDAVQALDASRAAAVVNLDDIDAGTEPGAGRADPHPPPRVSVEQAVIGELRAQFLWWRPGATLVDHPAEAPPDDHSLDSVRQLAAGSVGYRAEDGGLVLVEDPLAGRFEGWRSLLLLGIGFTALLLAVWKWFGGREPIPHFARLHGARDATARELETEYADSLRRLEEDERRHRQRLGDAEAELLALGGRLTGLDAARRQLLAREAELLRLTAAAGASAVEDYREANRQRRLSHDPPPSFWTTPWAPALQDRDKADDSAWGREHEQGLYEVMEAAERVRIANAAHAAPVAEAFAEARERLAQAARIPGARRRPSGPPGGGPAPPSGGKPTGQDVRLVPREGPDPAARLEIAS
ncbi:MAG: hypothetical protein OXP70_11295 [Acidobacteriota bacterium]|nr:hypothetical protein [Acidobacteriota bacterium]